MDLVTGESADPVHQSGLLLTALVSKVFLHPRRTLFIF